LKYQSVAAFDKHLKEGFPSRPAHVYMIAAPCSFERKKLADKIIAPLLQKHPEARLEFFDAASSKSEAPIESLCTQSLFGGLPLVYWDNADKLKDHDALLAYLARPSPHALLIIGASSMKAAADFYQKGKKEMVVLDLCDEKPWERQRRLEGWLAEEAQKAGKSLAPDAAAFLVEHIGPDVAGLEQELFKLVCFAGDRPSLTLEDVKKVSSSRDLATGWQLAESVVLQGKALPDGKAADLAFVLPFIGQLRYQLQTGAQVAAYLEMREDPARHLPQVRPQAMEKYVLAARQKKPRYFLKGLLALYDLEFAAKSSAADLGLLFDRFLAVLKS